MLFTFYIYLFFILVSEITAQTTEPSSNPTTNTYYGTHCFLSYPYILTFEGIVTGDLQAVIPVNDYYGSCGIFFSNGTSAIVAFDSGGNGDFCSGNVNHNTSGSTGITVIDSNYKAIMDVQTGFQTAFSFYYSSIYDVATINVYDGPGGTGNLLASVPLQKTPTDPSRYGGIDYCPFYVGQVKFSGVAYSVDFSGVPKGVIFDDISLGDYYPGQSFGSKTPIILPTFKPTRPPTTSSPSITFRPSKPTQQPTFKSTRIPTTYKPSNFPTYSPSNPTNAPAPFTAVIKTRLPTGVPSVHPTRPTVKPTFRPSDVPTVSPSSDTSMPTAPSATPTVTPSRPTFSPTVLPTLYPSSSQPTTPTPTQVPTVIPTAAPSTQVPTSIPSVPTVSPTAYCSNQVPFTICTNCTVETVTAIQTFNGIALNDLTSELISVTCSIAITLGINHALEIDTSSSTSLSATSSQIKYTIKYVVDPNSSPYAAYNYITDAINTAVNNGALVALLQSISFTYGHSFAGISATAVTFSSFTPSPTSQPNTGGGGGGGVSGVGLVAASPLDTGTLVGIIVGIFGGIVALVIFGYFYYNYRRTKPTKKMSKIQKSTNFTQNMVMPRDGDPVEWGNVLGRSATPSSSPLHTDRKGFTYEETDIIKSKTTKSDFAFL